MAKLLLQWSGCESVVSKPLHLQHPGKLLPTITWQQPSRLLAPSSLSYSCFLLASLLPTLLFPSPHGQPVLLYSLSPFLYPLNSPPHALNKLYSILYLCVADPLGGRDSSSWAMLRYPFPHTSPLLHQTYLSLLSLSFYKHISHLLFQILVCISDEIHIPHQFGRVTLKVESLKCWIIEVTKKLQK